MWTYGDADQPATTTTTRPDCPGCGEPDLHGDDFCHECGHSFAHLSSDRDGATAEDRGSACPACATGELTELDYGRTQCDSCGYTVRDEG